ncbi:MAG TPA: nucleoside-diphosphate sugar epimerase/dehydratase, partial [Anaerolineae bacterium]|nr:nucleoside-diphosphate sugar epimerase/dehydratase [Anaerolineae bacterium]
MYRRYWNFTSISEIQTILVSVALSTSVLTAAVLVTQESLHPYELAVPRSLPVLDGMLLLIVVAGSRLAVRALYQWRRHDRHPVGGRRVLTVGAGEAGRLVAQEMWSNPQLEMEPVAFADDDPLKVGTQIAGLPVLGTCDQIPYLVNKYRIQRIVVAMPSAALPRRQEIIKQCKETSVDTYVLPGMYELLAGHKTISRLPEIDINRLLNRKPVTIDQSEVVAQLQGMTVLVTGAGGSIGSELCRQIARFGPEQLILLGHGENSIAEISLDLRLSFPKLVTHPVIADVRNRLRMNHVIGTYRPDIIFHTAAHKHVPLMEDSVEEAITNNVLGTRNVLQAAEQFGVERFVLISTDKAVNPTSIMGATKRLAELLVVASAQRTGHAYTAVRFGNVLGSRGSVIPIFQRQIAAGGPVTITHPDMTRYFMTIPEAVQLVLQTTVLGNGQEVFVLDMGKPVRILDLATDLIKLSGLQPERDIQIVHEGIRPGEKLDEELFLGEETHRRTAYSKIFAANDESTVEPEVVEQLIHEIIELAQSMQSEGGAEKLR